MTKCRLQIRMILNACKIKNHYLFILSWGKLTEINRLMFTQHVPLYVVVVLVNQHHHLRNKIIFLGLKRRSSKSFPHLFKTKQIMKSQKCQNELMSTFQPSSFSRARDCIDCIATHPARSAVTKSWNNEKGWSRTTSSGTDRKQLLCYFYSLDQKPRRI